MATRGASGDDQGEQEKPFEGGRGFFAPPNDNMDGPGRGRVLAAFEVPEEGQADEEATEPLHLECVDAEWFQSRRSHLDLMLSQESSENTPLSVLEFTRTPDWVAPGGVPGSVTWYQVDYEPTYRSGHDALLYKNLFAAGAPVRVTEARRAEPDPRLQPWTPRQWDFYEPHRLPYLYPLKDYLDFAEIIQQQRWVDSQLGALLRNRNSSKGVAVYDVGQGNWQAILHGKTGKPFAYVDAGGGVLYNRKTFPKDFKRPPAVPLVILSHWDWDHWSSAARYRDLLKATWIAPSLSEKPIQRRFAMDIVRRGRLLTLPPGWNGVIEQGCLRLEGCVGKTENDRGISVTAFSRRVTGRTCLLPGDAAYRYIPSLNGVEAGKFDALCMSHHGGRLHSAHYPVPEKHGIAVNSAGPGNTYKHPLFKTLATHKSSGWPMPIQTGLSGSRPCHVYLPWGKGAQLFHGSCDMTTGTGLEV